MPDGLFANPLHWAILVVVVLIIFGPGKLPNVGSALGKSIKEFKRASREDEPFIRSTTVVAPAAPLALEDAAGRVCTECGAKSDGDARFCGACGASFTGADELEGTKSEPGVERGPVVCSTCQTENPAGNRFCAHCGCLIEHAIGRV